MAENQSPAAIIEFSGPTSGRLPGNNVLPLIPTKNRCPTPRRAVILGLGTILQWLFDIVDIRFLMTRPAQPPKW
jgi:hypothetical protein